MYCGTPTWNTYQEDGCVPHYFNSGVRYLARDWGNVRVGVWII